MPRSWEGDDDPDAIDHEAVATSRQAGFAEENDSFLDRFTGLPGIVTVRVRSLFVRPDRTTEIERKNLRVWVAPELQRHQRQQHRFAGAGRPDHEGMTDIPDMEGKPEWG